MPIAGLGGLHVLIALFFAVHVLRNGQPIYWLFILFSFPLLGSAAYFFVIYLPNSRLESGARKAFVSATKLVDPSRELREARAAYDYTPTAQNQMRLAAALLEAGNADDAIANYEACLKGPFASDPELRFGVARAYLQCGRYEQALSHLDVVRAAQSAVRAEKLALLYAQALAGAGRAAEAKAAFEDLVSQHGSFESRAEYAIWAYGTGDEATATRLQTDLDHTMKHWGGHTRDLNKPLIKRLNAARDEAKKRD